MCLTNEALCLQPERMKAATALCSLGWLYSLRVSTARLATSAALDSRKAGCGGQEGGVGVYMHTCVCHNLTPLNGRSDAIGDCGEGNGEGRPCKGLFEGSFCYMLSMRLAPKAPSSCTWMEVLSPDQITPQYPSPSS